MVQRASGNQERGRLGMGAQVVIFKKTHSVGFSFHSLSVAGAAGDRRAEWSACRL